MSSQSMHQSGIITYNVALKRHHWAMLKSWLNL